MYKENRPSIFYRIKMLSALTTIMGMVCAFSNEDVVRIQYFPS